MNEQLKSKLHKLEDVIGYHFKDLDLLKVAVSHTSYVNELRVYKWESYQRMEYLGDAVLELVISDYLYRNNPDMSEDFAWKYFESWKSGKEMTKKEMINAFKKLTIDMPNKEHYYMHDFEDLFVWNDLVHCFDYEQHHKSILTNGEEVEWFWSWTNKSEQREDGYFYRTFGYDRIRVPVDKWNGSIITWIPDENIKEEIY